MTGRRLLAGSMVLVVSVAGCRKSQPPSEPLGPHTPAPPDSITDPTNRAQRGAILAFAAQRLVFADPANDSTHSFHGQWDRALVDTLGDTAIVEPEVNIHRTDDAELLQGRIQMKIVLLVGRPGRTPQQIYDAVGVPPGISYVWVDSLQMELPCLDGTTLPTDHSGQSFEDIEGGGIEGPVDAFVSLEDVPVQRLGAGQVAVPLGDKP